MQQYSINMQKRALQMEQRRTPPEEPKKAIKVVRPPLRYFGGKWRLSSWIIEQFPTHVTYVEPYMGGASVFLRKRPSQIEIVNDLDGEVVNFFRVLRDDTTALVRAIDLTPYSRREWELAFEVAPDAGPVERARALYIRLRQSFDASAALSYKSPSWRRQVGNNRGKSVTEEWDTLDHLYAVAKRFKQAQLENRPALDIIAQADSKETLYYVDPPYVQSTRGGNDTEYGHEMTDEDHIKLLAVLKSLQGMVILSGYENLLYTQHLSGWVKKTKTTTTNANNQATEAIWLNPACVDRSYPLFNMAG